MLPHQSHHFSMSCSKHFQALGSQGAGTGAWCPTIQGLEPGCTAIWQATCRAFVIINLGLVTLSWWSMTLESRPSHRSPLLITNWAQVTLLQRGCSTGPVQAWVHSGGWKTRTFFLPICLDFPNCLMSKDCLKYILKGIFLHIFFKLLDIYL